jgi:anti-anti-sigma factor
MALEVNVAVDAIHGSSMVLEGELDIYTVNDFRTRAEPIFGTDGPVTIDLRGVDLIDSSGLAALTRLAAGRKPTLVCPNPALVRLFVVTGLDRLFDIVPELPVQAPSEAS